MTYSILGSFSKAVPDAVAINFAPSSGVNCSDTCKVKQAGCYARNTEARKPSIHVSLERKARDQGGYLRKLTKPHTLVKLHHAPWIRFSVFGSVPPATRLTETDRKHLTMLAGFCDPEKTHLPVETLAKVRTYQELGFAPRLSLGPNPATRRIRNMVKLGIPISLIVDPMHQKPGWTEQAKILAKQTARKLRKIYQGKILVCPAIIGSAKCGECKACNGLPGSPNIIIYPKHI